MSRLRPEGNAPGLGNGYSTLIGPPIPEPIISPAAAKIFTPPTPIRKLIGPPKPTPKQPTVTPAIAPAITPVTGGISATTTGTGSTNMPSAKATTAAAPAPLATNPRTATITSQVAPSKVPETTADMSSSYQGVVNADIADIGRQLTNLANNQATLQGQVNQITSQVTPNATTDQNAAAAAQLANTQGGTAPSSSTGLFSALSTTKGKIAFLVIAGGGGYLYVRSRGGLSKVLKG